MELQPGAEVFYLFTVCPNKVSFRCDAVVLSSWISRMSFSSFSEGIMFSLDALSSCATICTSTCGRGFTERLLISFIFLNTSFVFTITSMLSNEGRLINATKREIFKF